MKCPAGFEQRRHEHRWWRRLAGTMVARVFLLLLFSLLLSAALAALLASWHWRQDRVLSERQAIEWAQPVASLIRALDEASPPGRVAIWELARLSGIYRLDAAAKTVAPTLEPQLQQALQTRLVRPVEVAAGNEGEACATAAPAGAAHHFGGFAYRCWRISTTLQDGAAVSFLVWQTAGSWSAIAGERDVGHWLWPALGLTLALLLLAAAITRLTLKPMITLLRGIERLAGNIDAEPLPLRGPRDIRLAAGAFNEIQQRMRSYLRERASMLAAIAHDLQTPLTRLRLRLEQVPDGQLRAALGADLLECQNRVREGLDLARSLDEPQPLADVDLDALLQSACHEAQDAGHAVRWLGGGALTVRASAPALLRCVENLLSNAIKYAQSAEVSARRDGDRALIEVRDHGPGIAEADLERVFAPFVRLEDSRSRDTGGSGLGLTIVRNLMQRQGGSVRLRTISAPGDSGLLASLLIPLSPPGVA